MSLSEQALLIICCVGIFQAFLLSLVIYFYPKGDRSVNVFLAVYILAFCVPMMAPVVLHYSTWHNAILFRSALLLSGPFLYLYVLSFSDKITLRRAWPHFIVFFIQLMLDLQMYFSSIDRLPPSHQVPEEVIFSPFTVSLFVFRILQMLFYFVLSLRALRRYQRSIQQLYSETSRISLSWLRWLINGNLLLVAFMIFLYPLVLQHPEDFKFYVMVNTAFVTPYIYLATFKGLTQPTLWQVRPGLSHERVEEEIRTADLVDTSSRQKKKVTAPSPDKTSEIVSRAIQLMERDKLFRETELTLQELADKIEMPAYQVSQAINDGLNRNFYELVNSYRVEEAKRLLMDPKTRNQKIIALAQDAGFNSKTTFNTVFKKFTGYSPSEYRESQSTVNA